MAANFPGLVAGDTHVDGADLIEWISNEFWHLSANGQGQELLDRARNGSTEE